MIDESMSVVDILHSQTLDNWVSMELNDLGKSVYNEELNNGNENNKTLKKPILQKLIKQKRYNHLWNFSHSSDGLVDNELRHNIWPILIDIDLTENTGDSDYSLYGSLSESYSEGFSDGFNDIEGVDNIDSETLLGSLNEIVSKSDDDFESNRKYRDFNDYLSKEPHKDEEQAKLDINRSFPYYKANKQTKKKLKENLTKLITKLLRNYPDLNYYQGYHDVASVILLVFSNDLSLTYEALERITLFHLRDFMLKDIEGSTSHCMLITKLVCEVDASFGKLIESNLPYQGLSSLLTMFSHDLTNYDYIFLIWDFILSFNSISCCVYIYVAILLEFKYEIFHQLGIDDQTDINSIDKDMLFYYLNPNWLFKEINDKNIGAILNRTSQLIYSTRLNLDEISEFSVLKNTSKLIFEYDELIDKREYSNLIMNFFEKQNLELDKLKKQREIEYQMKRSKLKSNSRSKAKLDKKRNLGINILNPFKRNISTNITLGITIGVLGILINYYINNKTLVGIMSLNLDEMKYKVQNIGIGMNFKSLGSVKDLIFKFTH